jgi:hypothetical protein
VPAAEPHCDDKTITLAVETELAVDLQISSHLIDQAAGAPVTQPLSLWPTETSLRVGPTTLLRRVWH